MVNNNNNGKLCRMRSRNGGNLRLMTKFVFNICERGWVDNIKMDLQEVGCGHVDWIGLAQGRDGWRKLVNAVMNLRVP
jgi:hypothetical protein